MIIYAEMCYTFNQHFFLFDAHNNRASTHFGLFCAYHQIIKGQYESLLSLSRFFLFHFRIFLFFLFWLSWNGGRCDVCTMVGLPSHCYFLFTRIRFRYLMCAAHHKNTLSNVDCWMIENCNYCWAMCTISAPLPVLQPLTLISQSY